MCRRWREQPRFRLAKSFRVDEVLDRAAEKENRIAFVVPHGITWSLPLYEIALMTQRRSVERGMHASIAVITPESAPWQCSGPAPKRR